MNPMVWVNGHLGAPTDATVSATDRGVLLGEGVYETCGVMAGTPFALQRHLDRLRRSADLVGLSVPWADDGLRSIVTDVLDAAQEPSDTACPPAPQGGARPFPVVTGRLRLTVTGGDGPLGPDNREPALPTLLVMAGPTHKWATTSRVVIGPWRINERAPSVGVKATSHLDGVLALRSAQAAGADEALMANTTGALCEGTGSNVFLVVDGELSTPSLATGCLGGITRQLVCELLAAEGTPVVERDDLSIDDLRRATEVFLTSSTRNVHPVESVDGTRPSAPVPGPTTRRAAEALASLQSRDLDP